MMRDFKTILDTQRKALQLPELICRRNIIIQTIKEKKTPF